APSTVAWLKETKPELKRVATIAANDETGWNSQKIQVAAYTAGGFEVVSTEFFERSQNDFRAMLTKILAQNPDTIELDTVPPRTAGLMVSQARELGYQRAFTKFGSSDVELPRRGVGQAAQGRAEGLCRHVLRRRQPALRLDREGGKARQRRGRGGSGSESALRRLGRHADLGRRRGLWRRPPDLPLG